MSLNLTAAIATLQTRAARVVTARSTATRQPSVAARFLTALRAQVAADALYGTDLPLAFLVRQWCEAEYPATADRLTPWATIEAQLRVAAKAGALPADVTITGARKSKLEQGGPFAALVRIDSVDARAQAAMDSGSAETAMNVAADDAGGE